MQSQFNANNSFSLTDRGLSYSSNSQIVPIQETKIIARFLGQSYQVRRSVHPSNSSKPCLVYRGLAY